MMLNWNAATPIVAGIILRTTSRTESLRHGVTHCGRYPSRNRYGSWKPACATPTTSTPNASAKIRSPKSSPQRGATSSTVAIITTLSSVAPIAGMKK